MFLVGWPTLLSCAGQLGLVLLTAMRGARSPLALPLLLLCLCFFGWNFAFLAHESTGDAGWRYLDTGISPLTLPFGLHFVLVFTGLRRRLSWTLVLAYVSHGAVSALSLSAFFVPAMRGFPGSVLWARTLMVIATPGIGLMLWVLVRHLYEAALAEERMRARFVLAALVIGGLGSSTELWVDAGLSNIRLGAASTLLTSVLFAVVALRFRLLERDLTYAAGFLALAFGGGAVLVYIALFEVLASSTAMLVIGTATITFALVLVMRRLFSVVAVERAQRERLTLLGRLSAQMAHDLKTPLTAIKGVAQFLEEERAQGRSIDDQEEFLGLLVHEADRLARLIDKYRRLGDVDPMRRPVDVNDLVARVASLPSLEPPEGVHVCTDLAPDAGEARIDEDLITVALENLVRNAFEAMHGPGEVTLRTERTRRPEGVTLIVRDTGMGMDPRTRERALDEFHTTKESGSGLGLPFVHRVVTAHGGQMRLTSTEGRGTEVRLLLPSPGFGPGEA